jgi:hypothetical protein
MSNGYCLISYAFICASLYTILQCKNCQPFVKYEKSLNPIQLKLYKYSIHERTKLYVHGLIIGVVLASLFIYLTKSHNHPPTYKSCMFSAIILLTQFLYYNLSPKKIQMLPILDSKEQIMNWLEVYNTMKFRYHFGFLLGVIGFFLFSYGFINK